MVWHENVSLIVMLQEIDDEGGQYWPVNTTERFGNVTVLLQDTSSKSAVTQRNMKLLSDDDEKYRNVIQLQFNGWPLDQEVPDGPTEILHLLRQAKLLMNQSDVKTARILVHCRNGSGATGTFISLYTLLDDLQTNKTISVFNVVKNLRNERMEMVQTKMQYLFIYQASQGGQTIPEDSQTQLSIKELSKMRDVSITKRAKREYAVLNEMNKETKPNQDGVSSTNRHKNRFEEFIPLDEFRPVLKTEGLTFGSNDYINATIVQEEECGTVILTQTPLPSIFEDFWRLVLDYQCSRVIMVKDTGGTSQAFSRYWPETGSFDFGNISVECLSAETGPGYTRHQFLVAHRASKKQVTVEQIGFDIPRDCRERLDKMAAFIELTKESSSDGALLVHCLNGVGLSAVFAVARSQMGQLEREGTCDLLQAVNRMRKRNPHVITSQDEYALCLQLLKYLSNGHSEYQTVP